MTWKHEGLYKYKDLHKYKGCIKSKDPNRSSGPSDDLQWLSIVPWPEVHPSDRFPPHPLHIPRLSEEARPLLLFRNFLLLFPLAICKCWPLFHLLGVRFFPQIPLWGREGFLKFQDHMISFRLHSGKTTAPFLEALILKYNFTHVLQERRLT